MPASTIGPLATGVRGNVLSSASQSSLVRAYSANDAELGRTVDRLEARARENITRQRAAAERAENKRAVARAIVEEQMGIVEDWRGCQAAPAGAWNPPAPTVDDRLPCMTNDGLGRNDPGGGTQGVARSDLVAKLDALERYQDGDVSKVQLDTLQTQLIVMLGRLEAARVERDAMELAEEQELRMARRGEAPTGDRPAGTAHELSDPVRAVFVLHREHPVPDPAHGHVPAGDGCDRGGDRRRGSELSS